MNQQDRTVRTIRVRYSMIFLFATAFLFLISQILDNLFYDYTVIETEIIFIKKIDHNNLVEIELNEVVDSSNSLVKALKDNIKNTIDQVSKRISFTQQYQDDDDYQLKFENQQIKNKLNMAASTHLLRMDAIHYDNVYLLNVQNFQNENHQQSIINFYFDVGHNFYDLSQTINLHPYWMQDIELQYEKAIITKVMEQDNSLLLIHYNYTNQTYGFLILNRSESHQWNKQQLNYALPQIDKVAFRNQQIIYSLPFDDCAFHHIYIQNDIIHDKPVKLNLTNSQVQKTISFFFLSDNHIVLVYLEFKDQHYYLVAIIVQNENHQWSQLSKFMELDVTDEILSRGNLNVDISYHVLHTFNKESNLLLLCLFKKQIIYLELKQWMYMFPTEEIQKKTRALRLYIDVEKERFTKIQYSHIDQTLYILSETASRRFKMYLIDLSQIEYYTDGTINTQLNTLQLRMPFFKPGLIIKDFLIKRNQHNIVILFLFNEGEVACIQKLHYGEGVLKKTFLVELLDVILTLSFVGFFKYLKRILQRIFQKILRFFKRLQ